MALLIIAGISAAAQRLVFFQKPASKVAFLFTANTAKDEEIDISNGIMRNLGTALERDGRFQALDPATILGRIGSPDIGGIPKFAKLHAVNLEYLVIGRITGETNGRIKVAFRLWDVTREEPMLGKIIFTADRTPIAGYISDFVSGRLAATHE